MKKLLTGLRSGKILIRSTNWIGDAIMTTPAVRTIRENFPRAEITLLALPWVADVFAASPHVDRIMLYRKNGEHQGLIGRLKLVAELRRERFDLTILLQNAFEAALITTLAGIPARAGYTTDGRGLLLTHGVRLPNERKKLHQVHYYQELLKDLDLAPGLDSLFLQVPAASREWAREFTDSLGAGIYGGEKLFIGINPGASYGPAKRWPAERYGGLAGWLSRKLHARILVFGTEADREAAQVIAGWAPDHVTDLTGRTSLAQAMALIERCRVFVTNDSGLMHVSAALRTPTVAIFGSTNPVTTGPFSANSRVIRKDIPCSPCLATHCKADFRCMHEIGSDEVFAAVKDLLQSSGRPAGGA